ncbi:Serine/threonine-protein kinase dclk1 [Homalodisca vitripennis]|nr:Serine/threonine-protein kinase dclk1 [Homalodisca vitripennis]
MSLVVGGDRSILQNNTKVSSYNPRSVEVQRHVSDFAVQSSPLRGRKAKRIRFLCNGDKFYKGVVMAVTPERYRSFDSLLTDLTRALSDNVNLPSGVRMLFTMDGRKISQLEELEDGKLYVCSGTGETFKRVEYSVSSSSITKVKPSRSLTRLSPCLNSARSTNNVIRPRIIVVVRNGTRPRKVLRLLLNKRNAPSFDHALSTITDTAKLDTGAVRKVFTSSGVPVVALEDFFGEDDVFFVYGNERLSSDDFELEFEELKAIQAQRKSLRRTGGELKSGTHCIDELVVVEYLLTYCCGSWYPRWYFASPTHCLQISLSIASSSLLPSFLMSLLIWSRHLNLGLPGGLLPSGLFTRTFLTKELSSFLSKWPAHLILLLLTSATMSGSIYSCLNSTLCFILHSPSSRVGP